MGVYLARFLLKKRDIELWEHCVMPSFVLLTNVKCLKILDNVYCVSISPINFRSVWQTLYTIKPDEVYNLASQSSVGLSFEQPVETLQSYIIETLKLLECIRLLNPSIRFYNPCLGECFGDYGDKAADENTSFHPKSPYAVAKATSFWEVVNYREAFNLYACSGILFNHESLLRPEPFVTKKIVTAVSRIAKGSDEKLRLGNLAIKRDWGWAPEYVEAMWKMLQLDGPDDFVIATGQTYSLEEFVDTAFSYFGFNWKDYVEIDPNCLDLMKFIIVVLIILMQSVNLGGKLVCHFIGYFISLLKFSHPLFYDLWIVWFINVIQWSTGEISAYTFLYLCFSVS